MDQKRRELVEKIGVFNEKIGAQPVVARINALLLVSEKTRMTFNDIQEELGVSKSSVSNAIKLLLTTGQIDYITFPGERKRYFYSNIKQWPRMIDRLVDYAMLYRNLFAEVLELRNDHDPDFNDSIKDLMDFIDYLINNLPVMKEEFKKAKQT